MPYKRSYRPQLKNFSRNLRALPTPAEKVLWELVQGRRFEERKFRQQVSFDRFIVDFYCLAEKLVIELDGEPHYSDERVIERDRDMEEYLEKRGNKVIRFENRTFLSDPDAALKIIKANFLKGEMR